MWFVGTASIILRTHLRISIARIGITILLLLLLMNLILYIFLIRNVGGLPEDLKFQLVEPLRQLFKDEVRACGLELGLPYEMVYRQPFLGPGLGVRCLGAITRDRLEAVRESDAILREEFQIAGLDKKVWQYFTVVPDFKSVGVRDNARSFDWPVIIRAVNTVDAMTATIEPIDWPVLMKITDRILKEVKNVNRVCYDMSPKPNATIEWE